jgi:signal transduction histidine kinase
MATKVRTVEINQLNEELEQLVIEQTEALATTNDELQSEIAERKNVESERADLSEQVHTSREQLQLLSRKLLRAQEAERRVIARELHDEIGQLLTGVSLMLTASPQRSAAQAHAQMADAQVQVRQIIERVRTMALDLRPAMLDDLGLVSALVWLFERYTAQTSIAVRFEHRGLEAQRFMPEVETTAYRVVQEALTNVARHAEVHEAIVRLWINDGPLFVVIADHGCGFDKAVAHKAASSGLIGMYERTALLGGSLLVDSVPGSGTQVTAILPSVASLVADQPEHNL